MTNFPTGFLSGAAVFGALLPVCAGAVQPQQYNASAPVPYTRRAQDVVNALSISTHVSYTNSAYGNLGQVVAALKWLGINRVRDQMPLYPPADPRFQLYYTMLNNGMRMSLVSPVTPDYTAGYASIAAAMQANLDTIEQKYPNQIAAIEGLNEPDILEDGYTYTYGSLRGPAAVGQFQVDLYTMAKNDKLLASIPVWEFALNSRPWNQLSYESVYATNSRIASSFDFAAKGDYAGVWSPEFQLKQQVVYAYDIGFANNAFTYGPYNASVRFRPFGVKETGFMGASPAIPSVNVADYTIQSKLLLPTLLDNLILGGQVVNIYELADVFPDPNWDSVYYHWGMFDYSWHAKPAATVLHNFIAALRDTGASATSFTPTQLNVGISQFPITSAGAVPSGFTMEMERSDGTYLIAIWYEPLLQNTATKVDLPPPAPVKISVGLSRVCATASVYDPLTNTTAQAATNSWFVPVSLPDHPVILSCKPA